jgi:surfactin synthase thioesterase subunit
LYDLLTNVVAPESKKIIPIIELLSANHSTEKDTIIFFPPVVGIGKIFKPLANFISRKYNCYAINIPTFGDELRFQEKVTFFFDQIQQQIEHNNKKIILVGYSVGANFAFEIAKLFGNHANIEVVLIDRKIEKIDVTVN